MNSSKKNDLLPKGIRHIFHIAQAYAREYQNGLLAPEHLLKAILHKDVGLISFLEALGKDYYYLLDWADVRISLLPKVSNPSSEPSIANETQIVLRTAEDYQQKYGAEELTPFLLLAAIITPGVGFSYEQLKSFPLVPKDLQGALTQSVTIHEISQITPSTSGDGVGKNLAKYTTNRTLEAREGKLSQIIGNDKEVQTLFETLGRKNKSNILILGESGVGKTALIDAFVQRVTSGEVPEFLKDAIVYELDVMMISSEANYKGEIEDRMKKVLAELQLKNNAILVVENLDVFFEKNESLSGISAILKRGIIKENLRLITTSSIERYTKNIEPDKEFLRLIEKMTLEEPDSDMAFRILSGVKSRYEAHYNLSVPDEVLVEAIRLVKRYMGERSLPDSAFDLIDRTLSHINTMNDISEKEVDILKQKLAGLLLTDNSESQKTLQKLGWLYSEMTQRLSPLIVVQLNEEVDFHKLNKKEEKIDHINRILDKLDGVVKNKRTHVTPADLAVTIARQTGVPIGRLQSGERERLLNAESILKQRVVGQDHAIRIVLDALYESRSGLNKKGQPMASVFFLGPTGTGKTELTKALAEFLFQDESAIIRFDMSEFMESHSVATMTGAPAGYVGYEEGGLLVNKIRQKPYSIVLFDEIEKAHPDVFSIFLQIMDEGRIHDKLNRIGDFSNSLVVFTSNVGSDYISKSFETGTIPSFNELKSLMIEKRFKPEFLGRLSEVIPFSPITKEIVLMIFDIHLKGLLKTLDEMNIRLNISDEAKKHLALSEFSPALGARPIIGVIRNEIRRPLSKLIISGKVTSGSEVNLSFKDGRILWDL
jgi:ATPases with chaperone activity, ATP-binding subunit